MDHAPLLVNISFQTLDSGLIKDGIHIEPCPSSSCLAPQGITTVPPVSSPVKISFQTLGFSLVKDGLYIEPCPCSSSLAPKVLPPASNPVKISFQTQESSLVKVGLYIEPCHSPSSLAPHVLPPAANPVKISFQTQESSLVKVGLYIEPCHSPSSLAPHVLPPAANPVKISFQTQESSLVKDGLYIEPCPCSSSLAPKVLLPLCFQLWTQLRSHSRHWSLALLKMVFILTHAPALVPLLPPAANPVRISFQTQESSLVIQQHFCRQRQNNGARIVESWLSKHSPVATTQKQSIRQWSSTRGAVNTKQPQHNTSAVITAVAFRLILVTTNREREVYQAEMGAINKQLMALKSRGYIGGLVQERRNSSALAMHGAIYGGQSEMTFTKIIHENSGEYWAVTYFIEAYLGKYQLKIVQHWWL